MKLEQLETEAEKSAVVLPTLTAVLDELHLRCAAIEELIDHHQRIILQAKFGVAPGVLVRDLGNRKVYQVREVSTHWGHEKPWLSAQLRRKDGSFSARVTSLYSSWELVK